MHPRILSPREEQQIVAYLKADGEKHMAMRIIVSRTRRYLPKIREDLQLLEKLVAHYDKTKAK
jgi:hypothetical protein